MRTPVMHAGNTPHTPAPLGPARALAVNAIFTTMAEAL